MARYYEVTECEHGEVGVCDHIPTDRRAGGCIRLDCNVLHGVPCPGGVRRELEDVQIVESRYAVTIFDEVTGTYRNVKSGRYAIIPLSGDTE